VDGNLGRIIAPVPVNIRFLGNPVSPVVPMPRFLRARTTRIAAVPEIGIRPTTSERPGTVGRVEC